MNSQMTTIEVDLATAATLQRLKTKAEAQGVPLNSLLLPLAQDANGSSQQRAHDFVEWLKARSVTGILADDNRDSIYTREDEAL